MPHRSVTSSVALVSKLLCLAWLLVLLLPSGWFKADFGGLHLEGGLYLVSRTEGGQEATLAWLPGVAAELCPLTAWPGCDRWGRFTSSSLATLGLGLIVATCLGAGGQLLAAKDDRDVLAQALLSLAPLAGFCGVLQYTVVAVTSGSGWVSLQMAHVAAVVLVALTGVPMLIICTSGGQAGGDGDGTQTSLLMKRWVSMGSRGTTHTARASQGARRSTLAGLHAYGSSPRQEQEQAATEHAHLVVAGTSTYGGALHQSLSARTAAHVKFRDVSEELRFDSFDAEAQQRLSGGGAPSMSAGASSVEAPEEEDPDAHAHDRERRWTVSNVLGAVQTFFAGGPTVLEGHLWKLNSQFELDDGREGRTEGLTDLRNWRRRWFRILASADGGLDLGYMSEKDDGFEVVAKELGAADVLKRFEILPRIDMIQLSQDMEFEALNAQRTYDLAFGHEESQTDQQLPPELFPVMFIWAPDAAPGETRRLVLATVSERSRVEWLHDLQRIYKGRQHFAPVNVSA